MVGVGRAPEEDPLGRDALTVAEYVSLRAEILKLIELQSQLVSLTVIGTGAVLGAAVQTKNSNLAFIFPIVAALLGMTWLNHAHAIHRCGTYLAQNFEPRFGGTALGWERFVREHPIRFGKVGYWGMRAIFVVSSLAAAVIGWTLFDGQAAHGVVGILSSLVTVGTITLVMLWRESSPEHRGSPR